ncbi:hypothetical protein Fcan01_12337 [Folsomia candida]|uniref:DUF4806 domain-containing protein n=1 Tax=Folsomia candida TaxID=158441 RepID=A0A226E4D5_FOLCA|nr:hypothetical protein Fcan01_12337 [Folsomia candida]
MNNYNVVEFPEEETVEVVPSSWIDFASNTCKFPIVSGLGELAKLIKNFAHPSDIWPSFPCRIIGSSYENLLIAREKANRATVTSSIDSDVSPGRSSDGRSRRKRKQDDTVLQKVVITEKDSWGVQTPVKKASKVYKSFSALIPSSSLSPIAEHSFHDVYPLNEGQSINSEQESEEETPMIVAPPSFQLAEGSGTRIRNQENKLVPTSDNNKLDTNVSTFEPNEDQFVVLVHNADPRDSPSAVVDVNLAEFATKADLNVFKGIMLRQLLKIQRNQTDILDQLTRLGANSQPTNAIDYSTLPTFPLNSIVSYLALIGGFTKEEVVRGILRRIFSQPFACQISYSGKGNNKLAFKDFPQIHKLVFDSVRRHNKFSRITDAEIKKIAQDFFRFAPSQNKPKEQRASSN